MSNKFLITPTSRAIWFGGALFIGLTVAKLISGDPITYKTFLPGLVGGLAGGLAIYFLRKFLFKNKS